MDCDICREEISGNVVYRRYKERPFILCVACDSSLRDEITRDGVLSLLTTLLMLPLPIMAGVLTGYLGSFICFFVLLTLLIAGVACSGTDMGKDKKIVTLLFTLVIMFGSVAFFTASAVATVLLRSVLSSLFG